ncbi:Short-chain dehydrogenase/reductase SDR family and Glucose/ribitol dehydrogenase family and NAD(P)-binding domain-containing protein [Strongyloides ratti]|uniref:Short-chain dehydrogenase/reductase SDR family and Glucose/ribitol dehydrogenase family and NAD(P)-binding domain-containing protein n=1 Tax=Strongyloides ratti TaxID=34506 RepID=A0A090MZI0_STRRB|nr:Short-chain dehydrogenase/reductase SDR family and Glucose/ribitol dehydrogenase family and NAD(P)-binding domain-containing protein [Strongyloides ratti]CEF68969.1 Short-chain dehydrogenase/reductase SDR family and Glucose/ribitol dehydrogenase family and NAD(P)-binding domain-containing protein [Strongyloides ratti]
MNSKVINLTNKVAIITGASSGIGRETAILFNKLGANILLTGRDTERLNNLKDELIKDNNDSGNNIKIFAADLSKEEDCNKLINNAKKEFKKLDILVNNAGLLKKGTIEDTKIEDYDYIMNVNLRALVILTQLAVPLLKETKGTIINVSSVNGIRSFPGVLAYNISKAGVDQLTRCSALELSQYGIRVNSVNPGVTVTELHRRSGMDETTYKNFLEHSKTTHALGRPGEAIEVANTIAFLASDASSFITGASIPVDGGRHAMCPR